MKEMKEKCMNMMDSMAPDSKQQCMDMMQSMMSDNENREDDQNNTLNLEVQLEALGCQDELKTSIIELYKKMVEMIKSW